jgi:hypothetical protein
LFVIRNLLNDLNPSTALKAGSVERLNGLNDLNLQSFGKDLTSKFTTMFRLTGELHLLYVAAADTGLLARWRPIFLNPASSPEIGGSGSMATRLS